MDMEQSLPRILPVNELKNTANIMKICKESKVPIIITRNGYGEAVLLSIELYEELFVKMKAVSLINESLDDIDNGGELIDGKEFFDEMKKKYAK